MYLTKSSLFFALAMAAAAVAAFAANSARADVLSDKWPTCDKASSVFPAYRAYLEGNTTEIARLGCLFETPDGFRVRTLRCEPTFIKEFGKIFSYHVTLDATLPLGICEIDVWWFDTWRGRLFTMDQNIKPYRRF